MDGRPIFDLKVAELRRELEKRNKDKTGVKQVLLDRLKETLERDGHDPQTYRFKNEDVRMRLVPETSDHWSINGDAQEHEKVPSTKGRDPSNDVLSDAFMISDQCVQKKITEESVPYVVQVGEQEEDLDYDLQSESNGMCENMISCKNVQCTTGEPGKLEEKPESSIVTQQTSGASQLNKSFVVQENLKAADLKKHFSKMGKVISATVVVSTRTPGSCFGFVQMASAEDAAATALVYNLTEFGGCILRVELTDRKAPTSSRKPNGRASVLNKVKTTNVPSPQQIASSSLISRRLYIANRRTQLRRIAIRNAMLREQRRKSEILSTQLPPYSSKSIPNSMSARQLTRPKYGMSKDNLRPRGRLLQASYYQGTPQRQTSTRARCNHGAQPFSHRRQDYTSRRVTESYQIRRRPTLTRQSSKSPLANARTNSNTYSEYDRGHSSLSSYLSQMGPPTTRKHVAAFRNERPVEKDIRETHRSGFYQRRHHHPQSPARSYESSRLMRETQEPLYAGRNSFKSAYDDRSHRSESTHRPEPYHSHRNDFDDRKLSVVSRPDTYSSQRYRTERNNFSEIRHRSNLFSRTRLEESRREFRAVSRSPPRSRDPTMMRPYPVSASLSRHHIEISRRSRSPSNSHRSEIVEYGHGSEPKIAWQGEQRSKMLSSLSQHQSWRPATQAFFQSSAYANRPTGRRY
uniref:SAP domain-containing protein n=1 Tax=Trichobilharzia regenti TaxID=157069 RepID=A0AA85IYK1_TRIRE|nr:unnamed protein product [Trichobilharzia regenti]